ncbi:F-box only protein 36-like [Clytia hemisphaerica]|uniref:F-box domain-containing protein n=1 Tax=Clytia hemisphaerica TaxID=252671 RepID=A0A7M5V6P4_9CNID
MPSMIKGRETIIFERTGQAPSPSKDFHQLIVTEGNVIWRTWRVSLRKEQMGIPPSQNKQSYEDFFYDTVVPNDIKRILGEQVLIYVQCIVHKDWLYRMKDNILIKIFSGLELSDVMSLSQVCRHFRIVCQSNELWRNIYINHCSNMNEDIKQLGNKIGWKKTFFTDKLQLQKKASRMRKSSGKIKSSAVPDERVLTVL